VRDRSGEPDTPPDPAACPWSPVTALLRVLDDVERERARVMRDPYARPDAKMRRVEVIAERVVGELKVLLKIGGEQPRKVSLRELVTLADPIPQSDIPPT
jgi:hypothetical protein